MDKKDFALNLRKLRNREDCKLSFAELADAADLSDNYVRRLEEGAAMPTLETLMQLSNALGVTPNCLIFGDEAEELNMLSSISHYKINSLSNNQIHILKNLMDDLYARLNADENNVIGQRIEKARIDKGLSCAELSRQLGISSGYMRNIETGRNKPSILALEQICSILNLDINYLICDFSRNTELYVLNDVVQRASKVLPAEKYEYFKLIYNYLIGSFQEKDIF